MYNLNSYIFKRKLFESLLTCIQVKHIAYYLSTTILKFLSLIYVVITVFQYIIAHRNTEFSHETNILCVSEYEMPPDFKCVWEKQVTSSLKVHEHIARTEKLFMLHPDKLHTFKGC